ncbi:MAG: sigma-70 family RNA polymerase sigma factor [bacterium]|nr:sigma-70 family RNA polymerase sigma factor [bacterium]
MNDEYVDMIEDGLYEEHDTLNTSDEPEYDDLPRRDAGSVFGFNLDPVNGKDRGTLFDAPDKNSLSAHLVEVGYYAPFRTAIDEKKSAIVLALYRGLMHHAEKNFHTASLCASKKGMHSKKNRQEALSRVYKKQYNAWRNFFIEKNLRLVMFLAKRFIGKGTPYQDLIQSGYYGLMQAVERFDHRKGYRFSTYAVWWISQAITRSLMEDKIIHIPVYALEQTKRVSSIMESFQKRIGRYPTVAELASKARVNPHIAKIVLDTHTCHVLSLDTPLPFAKEDAVPPLFAEYIIDASDHHNPESRVARKELKKMLSGALEILSTRERYIVTQRFGLYEEAKTLDEIGNQFSLTRERIRQIEKEALRKIAKSEYGPPLREFLFS